MRFKPIRAARDALSSASLAHVAVIGALWSWAMVTGSIAHANGAVSSWTQADIGGFQTDRPASPNILGTVAVPIHPSPTSTRWAKLMGASLDQPALDRFTAGARDLSPEGQVAFIQSAVTHAVRAPPAYNCSSNGYWAPASETLARGMGDCFDIAIAKMEALRFLGFASRDLYLTTGRFNRDSEDGRDRESVALLVHVGEHFWLMTEQSEHVIEADPSDVTTSYTPVLTYGVGSSWVHGRAVKLSSLNR